MTPLQVRELVEQEIGGQWDRSNLHGVDLRTCLMEPQLAECRDLATGKQVELWLVLSECPGSDNCYGVGYDERSKVFCLVDFNSGSPPLLEGRYGGFLRAVEAM
jgi:hypothetical protein